MEAVQENVDGSNLNKHLSIDEILEHVGQLGKYQIIVMSIFSVCLVVPAYQSLIMVFIADSPPWRCSGINMYECNTTTIYSVGDSEYSSRCNMTRSAWEYTFPKSYTIVTQV